MSAPKRIQRKRMKGWRMPPDTIYVGRGSHWGNPYRIGQKGYLAWDSITDAELLAFDFSDKEIVCDDGVVIKNAHPLPPNRIIYFDAPLTREDVILLYIKHVKEKEISLEPLRGRDLCCWCAPDALCHADWLLEAANSERTP